MDKGMSNLKHHSTHIVVLCLLFLGLVYVCIPQTAGNKTLFLLKNTCTCQPSKTNNVSSHGDALEEALAEAATANKTVIITVINKAYVEGDKPMLDIFLDAFWLGEGTRALVSNLLLVTMDETSLERCKFLGLHCYKIETDGVDFDGEKLYMSEDFIKMMWRRTQFLGDVLKRGYNFIFTDTDILWLRNPFQRLSQDESVDVQISNDKFNGDQWSESNPINTGFYMMRSNNKTISLLDSWYSRKDTSVGKKEQDVLNEMLREGEFRKLGIRVRFLDTLYFSGFCEDSKDIGAVTTVHANCCRTISAKISDLMAVIRNWRLATSSAANGTSASARLEHVACMHSWRN